MFFPQKKKSHIFQKYRQIEAAHLNRCALNSCRVIWAFIYDKYYNFDMHHKNFPGVQTPNLTHVLFKYFGAELFQKFSNSFIPKRCFPFWQLKSKHFTYHNQLLLQLFILAVPFHSNLLLFTFFIIVPYFRNIKCNTQLYTKVIVYGL